MSTFHPQHMFTHLLPITEEEKHFKFMHICTLPVLLARRRRFEKAGMNERIDKAERTERTERTERMERIERTEKTERTDRTWSTDR